MLDLFYTLYYIKNILFVLDLDVLYFTYLIYFVYMSYLTFTVYLP